MQSPDEKQAQSQCPEKVRTVDWIRLCVWWFVDERNVACLFDLRVCYVYVLCFVRFAEAESHQIVRGEKAPKRESVIRNRTLVITDE